MSDVRDEQGRFTWKAVANLKSNGYTPWKTEMPPKVEPAQAQDEAPDLDDIIRSLEGPR